MMLLKDVPQPYYAAILAAADDARDAVIVKAGGAPACHAVIVEGDAAYDRAILNGVARYAATEAAS